MESISNIESMEQCPQFESCSASLCPLDAFIKDRTWYSDEAVCNSRKHGCHRWIRKQRSIQRRLTQCWLEKAITWQELFDASRPKQLSPEQIQALKERLARMRSKKREKA
jgi:hypothetical protein